VIRYSILRFGTNPVTVSSKGGSPRPPQPAGRADAVAVAVAPVAHALDLRREDRAEVLVLGQIREDAVRRLGELVLDMDRMGAHGGAGYP
jgi:hypothetical protein